MDRKNLLTLHGVNPYWDSQTIRKGLEQLEIDVSKIEILKIKKKCFCILKFEILDELLTFRKKFEKYIVIKNKRLQIKDTDENLNLNKLKKRQQKQKKKGKTMKITNNTNILFQVAQYYDKKYQEQLKLKEEDCLKNFTKLRQNILKKPCCRIAPRQQWLQIDNTKNIFQKIIGAEDSKVKYYRNKTEYTVSLDQENKVQVGFILNVKNDFPEVQNSSQIPIINPTIYNLSVQLQIFFQQFQDAKEYPNLKVYNRLTKEGCFRNILIRHSETTFQIIIKLICQFVEEDQKKIFLEKVKQFIEKLNINNFQLVSFIVEEHNGISNATPNIKQNEIYIKGEKDYIHETMFNLKFKVPIGGFFQVNPQLAENLFKQTMELTNLDENTILLDICAGTGTFGLTLGQKCKEVFFIECNQDSCNVIQDNIELNKQIDFEKKTTIFAKKIEDCIKDITQKLSGKGFRIVAIVDPPRAGLHPTVQMNQYMSLVHFLKLVKIQKYFAVNNLKIVKDPHSHQLK